MVATHSAGMTGRVKITEIWRQCPRKREQKQRPKGLRGGWEKLGVFGKDLLMKGLRHQAEFISTRRSISKEW